MGSEFLLNAIDVSTYAPVDKPFNFLSDGIKTGYALTEMIFITNYFYPMFDIDQYSQEERYSDHANY